ncbi:MAG: SDR family NAD(P)-dependent oxidoreductase [Acidimicrobiales bacterium]
MLDAAGASVVLTARRTDRLEKVAAGLTRPSLPVVADLRDGDAVDDMVDAALERFGRLDIVGQQRRGRGRRTRS